MILMISPMLMELSEKTLFDRNIGWVIGKLVCGETERPGGNGKVVLKSGLPDGRMRHESHNVLCISWADGIAYREALRRECRQRRLGGTGEG
jgi:hypothetical protein